MDQFTQRFVKRRLPSQAYGNLLGSMRFLQLTPISLLITFVSSQNLLLRPKTTLNNILRRILAWVLHLIPCNLQIAALRPPAKQAMLRAGIE